MRTQVAVTDRPRNYVSQISLREPDVLRELRELNSELPQGGMRAGVGHKVDLRLGDARQTMAALVADPVNAAAFDFVFLDADKASYDTYYESALVLLRPGGLLVADNVLWSGRVADETVRDPYTTALREFNARLSRDNRVDISMIPFADGLTLAVRR